MTREHVANEAQVLADQKGRFTPTVASPSELPDTNWIPGRILVSPGKVLLVGKNGKRTISLSQIKNVSVTEDAPVVLPVSGYLTLNLGGEAIVVAPEELAAVEHAIFRAVLDGERVLVKHPAVKGGVVQDTDWTKGRLNYQEEELAFATADGQFVTAALTDVGGVETERRSVRDSERLVASADYATDGTVVETEFTGDTQHVRFLSTYFGRGEQQNTTDVDLDENERAVLAALYSGISPLEVPSFVDEDIEVIEETYDRLIEAGLLTCHRMRREVRLKTRGRVIASESMDEA